MDRGVLRLRSYVRSASPRGHPHRPTVQLLVNTTATAILAATACTTPIMGQSRMHGVVADPITADSIQ